MGVNYRDFEIVGFDGVPVIECGRANPILHQKNTTTFFALGTPSSGPNDDDALTETSIQEGVTDERLTLLSRPVPAFPNAVVMYVQQDLLQQVERGIAERRDSPIRIDWQELQNHTPTVLAAVLPFPTSTAILDDWGAHFRDLATNYIELYLTNHDQSTLQMAEFAAETARATAIDHDLRCDIFVRHGLAVLLSTTPERLDIIFETAVRPECDSWEASDFLHLITQLREMLAFGRGRGPVRVATQRECKGSCELGGLCGKTFNGLTILQQLVPRITFWMNGRVFGWSLIGAARGEEVSES